MIHVSNENNLEPLRKACESVKSGTIRISSGWIRSRQLKQVISDTVIKRIRKGNVSLKVLIRIGAPDDVSITDSGVITFLENLASTENSDVTWRYSTHHHAKVFIAGDSWAMVGSFNLTGGGFGDQAGAGRNPEAGVILDTESEVAGAIDRFEAMWGASEELSEVLVGFVADPSFHDRFQVITVRPLPAGMFLQVTGENDNKVILAKVERSQRQNLDFFTLSDTGEPTDPQLFRLFSGRQIRQNQINGIAWSGDKPRHQLHVVDAIPVRRVITKEDGLVFLPSNLPPAVAGPVYSADPGLLHDYFNPADSTYAVLEENPDVPVSFDDAELLTKHFAVIGSTGSGKSYFVKKYIEQRIAALTTDEKTRVIIIDTHGEYNISGLNVSSVDLLQDPGLIKRAKAGFIEDIDDVRDILGTLTNEEKAILSAAFQAAGSARSGKKETAFADTVRNFSGASPQKIDWDAALADLLVIVDPLEKKETTGKPVFAAVKTYQEQRDLLYQISDPALKTELLDRLKLEIIRDLKNKLKKIQVPQRLLDFADQVAHGDYRLEGLNLIRLLKKPLVYHLNLHSIDDADIRQAVCGDLMREVFEESKRKNGNFRTLFIVDEAQNYAPEKASRSVPSYRWMKVLASEGRKFRVALLVMTQRPAYLSKDILAQCGSQAIFRLVNQGDIAQVEQTVEGISRYDLLQLPNFVAGQAIFTGVGMKMPVRVRVVE